MSFYPMPRYLMRKHAVEKIINQHILSENRNKNLSLLEMGYGAGEIFNLYAKIGGGKIQSFGYDFSEKAYETAKEQAAVKEGKAKLYHSQEEIDRKFDILAAYEVLEHIEDDKQALTQWKNYLKDENSYILISVPAHQKRWGNSDTAAGHYRRYEKNTLEELFKNCGLEIICIYTYDFPSNLILDPIRNRRIGTYLINKGDDSKKDLSKNSGVERDKNFIIKFLSNPIFWTPLIKLQELFYKTDLGSCYIILAKN